MVKYFLSAILFLFSVYAFSQDPGRSKFSAGLNIGYKTATGLGFITSYHANLVVQVDLMVGYTRYNGAKFGGGGKFYFLKPKKVNPFISACYSVSTGAEVKGGFVQQQKEKYKTYSNQYVVAGFGITILGEETGHSLQVGYSFNLNTPVVTKYNLGNGYYESYDKVLNSVKGGIMATYNLFLFFNKPRKR